MFDLDDRFLRAWGESDAENLYGAIDVDSDGYVYATRYTGEIIVEKLTPDGDVVATLTPANTEMPLAEYGPLGVAVVDQNEVYVASFENENIMLFAGLVTAPI